MVAETVRPGRLAIGRAQRLPLVLTTLAVLAQIGYPLTHGATRDRLTVAIVVLAGLAALVHAATTRGLLAAALLFASTAVPGFVVEALGVHTGVPFGRYSYASSLGVRVTAVPLVIALAWTMLAWPAALVAQRLVSKPLARVAVGAWALASWDLFLDPQMVSAGHWTWASAGPHLPGVPAVPVTNYLGWLVVACVVSLALQGILHAAPNGDDRVPFAFYLWTYASSVLALAAFLGLGAAAAWGALGMGLVAAPLALSLWRGR
jgi:uncharacterized membrane protein